MTIKNLLLVAFGGGLGASFRYWIFFIVKNYSFPYATLIVNIVGSFVLGIIIALSFKMNNFPEAAKLFFGIGFCGGFTTFSTFSFENIELIQQGKFNLAFLYIFASVAGGVLATWLGFKLINQ